VLRLRSGHLRQQKNPMGVTTPQGGGLHSPGQPGRKTLKEARSRKAHSRWWGETLWRDEAGLVGSNAPGPVQVQDGSQPFHRRSGAARVGIVASVVARRLGGREPHGMRGRKP